MLIQSEKRTHRKTNDGVVYLRESLARPLRHFGRWTKGLIYTHFSGQSRLTRIMDHPGSLARILRFLMTISWKPVNTVVSLPRCLMDSQNLACMINFASMDREETVKRLLALFSTRHSPRCFSSFTYAFSKVSRKPCYRKIVSSKKGTNKRYLYRYDYRGTRRIQDKRKLIINNWKQPERCVSRWLVCVITRIPE